jgi:hypothetical protein
MAPRAARRVGAAVALVLAAGALGSCGGGPPVPRIPQAVVDLTITEYHFGYRQPVPAGRVVFRVVNAGRQVHRVAMLELPRDFPPLEQQLRGTTRRSVVPFAGIGGLEPGASNTFAVDLAAGRRYAFIDTGPGPGGESSALLGLASEFSAGGGIAAR